MKIKRKEYEKELADRYWDGMKAGINFALDHPEDAARIRNNTQALRKVVETSKEVLQKFAENLKNILA